MCGVTSERDSTAMINPGGYITPIVKLTTTQKGKISLYNILNLLLTFSPLICTSSLINAATDLKGSQYVERYARKRCLRSFSEAGGSSSVQIERVNWKTHVSGESGSWILATKACYYEFSPD